MGQLIECKACGRQISKEAKACPQCGAPPKRAGFVRVMQVIVGVLAALLVISAIAGASDKSPEATARAAQPAIEVTADQLRKDYETNEVRADEQYRGRTLIVTGTVDSIKKDVFDDPYIRLRTSDRLDDVAAHFPEEHAGQLGAVTPGSQITVRCIGNNVVLGSPQLKDCVLQ